MLEAKIYGLCLERLKYQIKNTRQRSTGDKDIILLECYNTGDLDDIIDILELYDIEERTFEGLREKLEDLSYTVSALTRETLFFDLTQEGHLGLYLSMNGAPGNHAEMFSVALDEAS
ncbi:MAG: hypothetical protein M1610_04335 [Nitrospirae bacterium]|nr:hypothetical protein [Nitrospirota bacterium]MDA8338759.1 hypothetical protein [Nitrospiraceae bacterium]